MATNAAAGGAEEPREEKPSGQTGQGFFTIYKKGQGYWTRMGTVLGAALVGALTAHFLYTYVPVWMSLDQSRYYIEQRTAIIVAASFLVLYGLLAYWLMNKPTNADFLIATDSEMKKVNWTSRRELIGSTKVVIVFMLLIAVILFLIDTIFSYLFYFIDVLKFRPF